MSEAQLSRATRAFAFDQGLLSGLRIDAETAAFLRWAFVWLLLSNAGFMVMWYLGAPPRGTEILATGVIGLVVRGRPFWLQALSFTSALIYSIFNFISLLFNLTLFSLVYAVGFLDELSPTSSVEYVVVGIAACCVFGLAFSALRRPTNFEKPAYVIAAFAGVCALAATDSWIGSDMRGHYKRVAVAGAPFESASQISGFAKLANGKRHLLLVMVESLGKPVGNAEMERKLFAFYKSPEVRARYDISTGTSLYYNSTTAGEMRELCGRWGDYFDVLDTMDSNCLPARLAAQGYRTEAIHDFTGDMFERETWYPHVGFQKQSFVNDLTAQGARSCGGVFPGACDRDIPKLIREKLKAATNPTFMYWLTLNSHLPVPTGQGLKVEHCERVSPTLAREYPMICRQFAIFDEIDQAMVKEITASDFPETDILIVGDHMPPYYDRHSRSQFAPDRVPWILLKAKRAPVESQSAKSGQAPAEPKAEQG